MNAFPSANRPAHVPGGYDGIRVERSRYAATQCGGGMFHVSFLQGEMAEKRHGAAAADDRHAGFNAVWRADRPCRGTRRARKRATGHTMDSGQPQANISLCLARAHRDPAPIRKVSCSRIREHCDPQASPFSFRCGYCFEGRVAFVNREIPWFSQIKSLDSRRATHPPQSGGLDFSESAIAVHNALARQYFP